MAFLTQTLLGDRGIQLGREEFARTMQIGTNWQKIRLGIRVAINAVSSLYIAPVTSNTFPLLGISQGTAHLYSDNNTTDFMGAVPGDGPSLTYAGTPPYLSFNGAGGQYFLKTGTTLTVSRQNLAANAFMGVVSAGIRIGVYLDITKGSDYSLKFWLPINSTQAITHVTRTTFLANMELDSGTPTGTGAFNALTVPYSGAGLFDSPVVLWRRSVPYMEINDFAVTRFY